MARLFERYKKMSKALKASFWFMVCSVLQKGISFLVTPVYTRLLTTEEYGLFTTYSSWLSIISIIATFNLSAGVLNNILNKKEDFGGAEDKILSSLQFLEILLIIMASSVLMVLNLYFPHLLEMDTVPLAMLCVTILFNSAVSLWTTKQKFGYNYIPVVAVSLAFSLITPAVNILAIALMNNKEMSLIVGSTLASAMVYCAILFINIFKGRKVIDIKLWRFALLFNLPLIPHYLSLIVLSSSDKIMISKILSPAESALYSIPYSLSHIVSLFSHAINDSLIPFTYKSLKSGRFDGLDKKVNGILVFLTVIIMLVCLAGPEIVLIMGGAKYFESRWVIPPVVASVYFTFLYPLFANVEFYYHKRLFTMFSSVGAALLNIVLNYVFINMFGYYAAAFTTLFCYMVLSVLHYVAYKIISKKQKLGNIYDEVRIAIIGVVVLAIVGISYVLYLNDIARYCFAAVVLIVCCVFYKKIYKSIIAIFRKEKDYESSSSSPDETK